VLGACWPLNKFWENLVIFDHFWDFDSLSKMEHHMKKILQNLDPILGPFWVLGICNRKGMLARGFTHA
jgi:hypothetical protein